MVTLLATLLLLSAYAEKPYLPSSWGAPRVTVRGSALEVLFAPHEYPWLTAVRTAHLAVSSAPTLLGLDLDMEGLALKPVPFRGISIGEPQRGRLSGGVALPENPALYWVRRPEYAYGSSHVVFHLQLALAKFRKYTDYPGPLIVSDLSKSRGGRHEPHHSHQSGRDVDIWLPLRCDAQGVTVLGGSLESFDPSDFVHFCSMRPRDIDWDASWQLVKALLRTGQVDGVFLSSARQPYLREAARRDGLSDEALEAIIQYPSETWDAAVRHAKGHHKHIHVRFRCADYETSCR